MTIDELLVELGIRDLRLRRSGGDLILRGNDEALEPSLIGELRTHKGALLGLIGSDSDTWWSPPVTITPEMLSLVRLTAEEIERIVEAVPGGAANVQDIYPLAPLQEGILFHHLMGGDGDPYLRPSLFSFDSRARLDGYIRALQAVIDRHDILRTAVVWEGLSEPVQVVWRKAILPVEEVDLEAGMGDAAQQLHTRFNLWSYRMDVRRAPLLRVVIAQDEEKGRWLMMLLRHHLAGDHSTLEMMHSEIQAYLLGEEDRLPAPLPFRNLVAQALLGVSREEHETYFRKLLGDVEEPTAPFGLLDVRGDGSEIKEARLKVDAGLARRIREHARKMGVSAASLCHVAWGQVLGKVSGREDVVFGSVLFGRMQGGEGADRVMGLFINTLPVRIQMGAEAAERSVRGTHKQLAELLRHEHASLALAQRCSGVPAPTPLFTALLNYRHSAGVEQGRSQERKRAWEGIRGLHVEERTNYPFTLSVDDLGEGFGLTAQVEAAIGPVRVCQYMHTALASLVQALEVSPAIPVCRLNVLPVAEREQLLYEWNETKREYSNERCVHELFEEQVARAPEAAAVVFEDQELSYGELNRRANQLAHYLRELGVRPDMRVAICAGRGFEMIVGLLGVLKAGGAYVPLDPAYPVERLSYMLEDCAPVVLLTQAQLRGIFDGLNLALPVLDLAAETPAWQHLPGANLDPDRIGVTSGHLAYVIYTSGSTGKPKGVMLQHRGVCNLATVYSRDLAVTENSRVLQFASFSFDACAWETMMALCRGARLYLVPPEQFLAGDTLIETVAQHAITHVTLTPAVLAGLPEGAHLESIRVLIVAGEMLTNSLTKRWSQGRLLINAYGPTETTICATMHPSRMEETGNPPIGKPIANTRIYILDGQGEPVPVGVAGEIHIGGAGIARGYLNRGELTAERFRCDPFVSEAGARMYKTGDLGRWRADGNIEFLGRNDFQVKIRGFRIELGEIESRLAEYPGLQDAVVLAREDTPGDRRLVAYYTCREQARSVGAEELRAHLSGSLPEYMVPAAYVRLDALPLTPNGKLDRRALPAPEIEAYAVRGYEAPKGEMETKLSHIWEEILKLERVGRHDNFFSLGGHSLLAVRVITRARQALGVEVSIRDLFAHPVLADLARILERAAQSDLPPITRAERSERLPLSFAQQRLWFLAQMGGVSQAYHIPFGLRLKGKLDRAALRQALNRILARHEALRTTFAFIEEQAVQRIAAAEEIAFHLMEHDLREHSGGKGELQRLMTEEARTSFDLEAGPLIRGRLIQMAEDEHVLLITMHHIVSDGWSMGVLIQELSALYGAFVRGEGDPLAPLEIQYADYAVWQRRWIEGEILRQQGDYWKRALAGVPALLELPTDRPRPAEQDFAGDFAELALDEKLSAGLRELSKRRGATLYMTLLAGWAALLARLSGQSDVVIGSPVANRGRAEIENLIGFFVNTLVLRVDVSSPTVSELLAQVKEQALAAQQHQDIPFEQVVELVQPVRSLAHSALFQATFTWQNTPRERLVMPGLELRPLETAPYKVAKYDLTLSLGESGERIVGSAGYATALFEAATVARYMGYFRTLLEGMVAAENEKVNRLAILPPAERRQLLYEWNETKREYSSERCVHELFEEQVARTPEAAAVVFEDQELSYGELNRRANQLAHYLRKLGVRPDMRVAICVERGFEMVVGLLGVLKAGGAYVPLDPAYPVERLSYMLEDCAPVVLLTQAHLRGVFAGLALALPVLDLEAKAPAWQHQPETNLDARSIGLTPRRLAYVIYTSGSTGKPKGVMVQHQGLCNLVLVYSQDLAVAANSRVLQFASFSFDACVWETMMALTRGARLYLVRQEQLLAGDLLIEKIAQHAITHVTVPPAVLAAWPERANLDSICVLVVAGEALTNSLMKRWGQGRLLINAYGPTETTICATMHPGGAEETGNPPIGKPIANTRMYILDSEGQPVPVGVAGEIYINGDGIARGYLNRGDLTAERFVPDPYEDVKGGGARMYRTGDLGRWRADGNIEFLGRNDFQVKIRGFRIELGEIESRLMEYPGIRDAVVLAREDTPGDRRLVAYYTSSAVDASIGAEELRAHLSANLPEYMVPAAYVPLENIPLTPNGKLDRKALPAPEGDAYATREYEAPQGETETKLAQIWAEILKVERVGRHDNFFSMGGHSLLVVTVIERMRRIGLEVDVRMLFAASTLATLAAAVGAGAPAIQVPPNRIPFGCQAIVPEMLPLVKLAAEEIERIVETVPGGATNVQDIYPLAPLQEGILFHHLMGGDGDPYLVGILYSFDSRARLDGYIQALQAVIDRHDILRTGVVWEGLSEPVQVVWRKAILPVEEVMLEVGPGDASGQLYARFNPRQFRIDVRQAPLLRLYVAWDREKDRWLMMMLRHHLAGDHSTLEVMQAEIQAHLLGEADRLPAPLPFRNLVAQAKLGVSLEEHEAHFRKLLGDLEEPTAPFGLLDVRGDGSGIQEARLKVDTELARRIREHARKLGVSAASLCHVAWGQVLGKVSAREDVVFGSVLFGRMQGGEGADRVMGLFINTLPVRIRMGEEAAEKSVRGMHRQLAELLRHEHASLALAQRCSGVSAPRPLFSALLNYRHSAGVHQVRSEERMHAWEGMRGLYGEERTNYPVTLCVDDFGEQFGLRAQVASSVDANRVCQYMHTALASLIQALESAPGTLLCTLNVLPSGERQQLLYEWNDTQKEFPGDRCVHELFEAHVERAPEAVAVVFEDRELSYGELNRRANQLAHYLRELGVKPDARVAICLERGFEMIVGILGILKAGGAYVPLDPGYPAERLNYMLEDCAPAVLLSQAQYWGVFAVNPFLPVLDMAAEIPEWRHRPGTNPDPGGIALTSRQLAYVMYTSGSAGQPKGVMVDHRAISRLVLNNGFASFEAGDRVAFASNPAFDASTLEVWAPLLNGARIVVIDQPVLLEPARFGQALKRHAVNILWLTVGLFNNYADLLSEEFSRLRYLIVGGDALDPRTISRLLRSNPPRHLLNGYGPTETTTFAATYEIISLSDKARSVPIGKAMANAQIYILDREGEPVPVGAAGEIHIAGAGVARGYLDRAELTAKRFVPDPFSLEAGTRMYKTGDLGRWLTDGNVEFLGRNDFQVKIRGFRIELGEIESRLAEYPGLRDAVVLAREDTPGDKRLVAYYTCNEAEGSVGAEKLQAHLSASLPHYMVPAAYVHLDVLPLTANGKLDRRALLAPETDAYAVGRYEPPQGEMETKLAGIWMEVLKLDRVGRRDDFFSLGGNSLLTVKMVNLLEQAGIKTSVSDVFQYPTIESLAARIAPCDAPASENEAILIRRSGTTPPLFLVHEGTGTLLYIHPLAACINEEISVYGLPAKPADEDHLQTVEGMATRMVRMIRSVQPVGPYRLAGWSFGGALAYEIATQLIGADQEIDFLGLLDTHYPSNTGEIPRLYKQPFDPRERLLPLIDRAISNNEELQDKFELLRSSAAAMSFEALVQKCREMLLIPKQFSGATTAQIGNWLARLHSLSLAYMQYSPQQLPIPVHLFRAERDGDPVLGWDAIVPDHLLKIIPVPGTHHSMMVSPNVEVLGQTLSQAIDNASAVSPGPPEGSYSAVVTLQAGRHAENKPLFCIPGAGNNAASFVDLTMCLDPLRPVYGLQPRGLEGELVPHSTVSAASETYMRALEEIYPKGPIHLLGHSFGGWVAFDMAQRFLDAGRTVASLILVDTEAPDQDQAVIRECSPTDEIAQWLDQVEQIVGRSLDFRRSDFDLRNEMEQIEKLHQLLVREGVISSRVEPETLRGPLRVFATSLRTHYQPSKSYPGPVQLVVADDAKLDENTNRLEHERISERWKWWAPNLACLHASGNHMTMLKEPYVRSLVQLLSLK